MAKKLGQGKDGAKDSGIIKMDVEARSIVSVKDFERILTKELGYEIKRNQVTGNIEANGIEMTDGLYSKIRAQVHESEFSDKKSTDLSSPLRLHDAINVISDSHSFHPIKHYLNFCGDFRGTRELKEDWLQKLVNNWTTDDQETTYLFLKKWLLGNVARIFSGFQNYTLVIKGPQGIGKSYFAEWLTSGVKDAYNLDVNRYFQEGSIDPSNKDHVDLLATKWIWALDEIGGTMRKADRCALKEFLTKSEISIRRPYERFVTTRPRLCSIIASTNEDEFLDDPTGNRRYLVLDVQSMDHRYSSKLMQDVMESVEIDGLWGQVMEWFRAGETPFLDGKEREIQNTRNAKCEKIDPLEDWLKANYEPDATLFTASNIILDAMREGGLIYGSDKGTAMRLSETCKKLGWSKVQGGGAIRLKGYRIKPVPRKLWNGMHANQDQD